MNNPTYTRRTTLKMGAITATAAYAYVAAGISLSGKTWAMTVNTLDDNTANALLQISRSVYPHPMLDDLFYARCVESIDAKAGQDPALKAAITEGVATLTQQAGGDWASAPAEKQAALLQAVATEPFFQAVRGDMVVSLYDNPGLWPQFGYEGPSFPKGGYINRGFNDIDWLPETGKGEAS